MSSRRAPRSGPPSATARVARAEALLRSLAGISAARILADATGRIREIRVVAENGSASRQIARDVASALLAAFGLAVDPDIVAVVDAATLDTCAGNGHAGRNGNRKHTAPTGDHHAPGAARHDAPRPAIEAIDVEYDGARSARARVCLALGHRSAAADAADADPLVAAATAAVRALQALLGHAAGRFDLDDVRIVDLAGHECAVAAVRAGQGRAVRRLAGAAPVDDSREAAAARAALRAADSLPGLDVAITAADRPPRAPRTADHTAQQGKGAPDPYH